MKVLTLKSGESLTVVKNFENSLKSMQEFVGGYIEMVQIGDMNVNNVYMISNEEGKLVELDKNFVLISNGVGYDVVHGNVLFVGMDKEGNTVELSDIQIDYVNNKFDSVNRTFNIYG